LVRVLRPRLLQLLDQCRDRLDVDATPAGQVEVLGHAAVVRIVGADVDVEAVFVVLEDVRKDIVLVVLRVVGRPVAESAPHGALNRDRRLSGGSGSSHTCSWRLGGRLGRCTASREDCARYYYEDRGTNRRSNDVHKWQRSVSS